MKYIYSAIFTQDDEKIVARVPDLPGCVTSGSNIADAIAMATDAASMLLVYMEDNGLEIPPAANQADIPHSADDIFSLIQVDTLAYRAQTDTRAVRKNVSLPHWMAALADRRGINCSQVLQQGLLRQFDA